MTRTVSCLTEACPVRGVARVARDVPAGPGLVSRPALYCAECGNEVANVDRQPPIETAVVEAPENTARRTKPPKKRTATTERRG